MKAAFLYLLVQLFGNFLLQKAEIIITKKLLVQVLFIQDVGEIETWMLRWIPGFHRRHRTSFRQSRRRICLSNVRQDCFRPFSIWR